MKYKIDKGIPIPKKPGKYQELLGRMKKGDSVLVTTRRERQGITGAATKLGIKIVTRQEPGADLEDPAIVYRVWRAS